MDILQKSYPIAPDQIAMTYLDDYILLETEHQKHQSLYGEKPDYPLILQKSNSLFSEGSGHFLVIMSASNAMLQIRGWAGFSDSLLFLNRIFSEHWNKLFPSVERLKGRVQMLDWLIARWQQFMETHPTQNLSPDFLHQILTGLNHLQKILNQFCGNEINLLTLIKPLQSAEIRLSTEKTSREAQQKSEQERLEKQALEATLDQHSKAISQEEYLNQLHPEDLYIYARKRLSSEYLARLNDESQRYAIFKHHRAMLWWGPEQTPEPFDWEAFSVALHLKAEENWLSACIAFETLFLNQPLFLDLQYHLCDCLELLEADPSLLKMLKKECQEFCREYPELAQTKMTPKIPSANKQTRAYFELFQVDGE
jgi:predicted component of type VI protein secretion system